MRSARAAVPVLLAAVFALAPAAVRAEDADPEAMVDALNAVFGKHPGTRGSHAKGVCVRGAFTPAAGAAKLSKAPQFARETPLIGRFSLGGGNPKAADNTKTAARGFALRFDLGGGANTDLVMLSAPVFFARTPEQFLGFLAVRAPRADGAGPDPEKIKAFAAANPETERQGAFFAARPVSASYASVDYWAIHAFTLANAAGEKTLVKFKALPAGGEVSLTDSEAKAKGSDFLAGELAERLDADPAAFDLVAIVGEPGDPADDPTAPWPEEQRKTQKLGTISVTGLEPAATCDAFMFDPANVADGVEGPDGDRIFAIRSPAYAVSFTRRAAN